MGVINIESNEHFRRELGLYDKLCHPIQILLTKMSERRCNTLRKCKRLGSCTGTVGVH